MRRVLLIGGWDPSGRAGLVRDLTVAAEERVATAAVPTCLTVQDMDRVRRIEPLDPGILQESLEAALSGRLDAVKVGLVVDMKSLEVVRRSLKGIGRPLVVDPVLTAGGGDPLTCADLSAHLGGLIALAHVVTPNRMELEALTRRRAATLDERRSAARSLRETSGCGAVLSKGGHADQDVDVWVGDRESDYGFHRLAIPGLDVGRGKGCELGTRIAVLLAKGLDPELAARLALDRLGRRLRAETAVAHASPPTLEALNDYEEAMERLLAELQPDCVPEVGSNLAHIAVGGSGTSDLVGLAGRITIAGDSFAVAGRPLPDGPHHTGRMARASVRRLGRSVWVFNHRWRPELLSRAGQDHVEFQRLDEPPKAISSMDWMIEAAINRLGRLPAYVSDAGMPGKEAMIRILAHSPHDLLARHRELHRVESVAPDAKNAPRAESPPRVRHDAPVQR